MKRPFRATIPLTQTLIALPAIWAALPAAGQSTWNGGATTDWSADINWSPAPPESGDDVIIADTTTGNLLVLDDGSRTIGSLTFGGSGTRATTAFNIRTGNNTLTIQNGVVANGNFTTGNVFNVGGKITIAANQVWAVGGDLGAVNTDKGVVISNGTGIGELTMTGDLTKTGSGQLSLVATTVSGAGNFVVNEGALKLNAGSSSLLTVGGTGNITVNNNASLFVSRNSGTLSLTRDIVLNNSGNLVLGGGGVANATTIASNITWNGTHVLELQNSGNSFVSTGAWSGSGSVTKTGPGTIHLAGDYSEHTGSFTISSGRVRLGNGGTEGFLGSGAFTNNGIFEFNRSDDFTFLKNISGTGSVEKSLSNTVILAGENTYGGYTYIRGGSLQIGEGATLSSSTSVVLTGAGSTFDVNGQTLTVAALHSGSSSDTTTNVHLGTNGKLTVTGNAAVSGITNTASNYYGIISGIGDIDYNNASNPQGIWTLQNASNSFTGDVTITSGRLRLNPNNTGSDGALGDWSNRLIFNGTPVESFVNGEGTASIQQSVAQDITIESSRDVVINDGKEGTFYVWGSRTMTVDAGIEGGGTLRKEDGGTLVLTAANSYEGGTKLVAGIIRAENNGAFGTGDVVIGSTSNGYNNRVELSGVTIANDFTVNTTGNTGFLGAITATGNALSVINGDVTISANVGNGGHLASVDDAVLRINGAINVVGNIIPNARTGTVEVAGGGNYTQFNVGQGTLRLGADNGLNSAAHLSLGLSNPATFDLNGYDQTLAQLTRAASSSTTVTNNGTTASTLTINSTVDHTYSGVLIDGTGGFSVSKSGSGSFALSGDNAGFTGDLTVTGGTVQINGAFGGSVIVQGGTLSGTNTISGPVAIHSGTLAPGNSPGTLSITNALELSANSLLSWELNALDTTVGLGINDLVTGITNLTLDGILSVTGTGDFTTVAEGTAWRLFEYSGSLDDRTLEFGSMPALADGLQWTIDTSSFGQINLVVGSVPEPSVVLLGALGGCFLLRRRR